MKDRRLKCIKYILFLFNLIITISGLVLVVAGIIIQAAYHQYLDFLGNQFFFTPSYIVILGCFIFVIAFLGCCGAINENHCMILTFSCLLAIIFIFEIGAAVAAYHLRKQLGALIKENMETSMKKFNQPGFQEASDAWNMIQQKLSCCGAESYQDWVNTTFSLSSSSVPDSCCVYDVVGCGRGILNLHMQQAGVRIHVSGCLGTLSNRVRDNVANVGGTVIGIAFVQFVGVVFSFCLATNIRLGYQIV